VRVSEQDAQRVGQRRDGIPLGEGAQDPGNGATQLFAEHGFDTVTLAQIAEASDVSIKTIFNHFGSKEDLHFDRVEELSLSLDA